MKIWKQCTLLVFMALLVFTFIGCGDDNKPEQPQLRTEIINFAFGASAKLRTTMLQSEHNDVKDKVINAIDNAYNNVADPNEKEDYEFMHSDPNHTILPQRYIIIDVGNRPIDKTYETTNINTLYLNLNALNIGIPQNIIHVAIMRQTNGIIHIE